METKDVVEYYRPEIVPPAPVPPAVAKAQKRRRIAEIGLEIARLNHERAAIKADLSK
jgi:hypothetical protein